MKAHLRLWRRRLRRLLSPALHAQRRRLILRTFVGVVATAQLLGVFVVLTALWRAHLEAPAATFLLRDRQGRFLGEVGAPVDGELGYWPVEALPPRVIAATLALEDRHFGSHPGVDPGAMARAVFQNLRHRGRVSGASTLAMQIARMQSPGERGYLRKAQEALTAVLLTARYGREEILRQYLRIVPYGNRIHGIAYAARRYFDKPVEDLSWAEIAFLAGIPQAPGKMNVYLPAGRWRAVERGQRALRTLAAQGVLSAAELELAQRQLKALRIPYKEKRTDEAMHAVLRLQSLLTDEKGEKGEHRGEPLIRTTLDLDLQRQVTWMTDRAVRAWADRGAGNAAVIVIDLQSREVRAWVGSAGYFDKGQAGSIDYTRVRRSAGSALKPFLYAAALDRGLIRPSTVLDDLQRGPGGITNADDLFLGPLLPRVALANSRNVPAVDLLARLGLDQGYALFRDLGLTEGALPAKHYGLGIAIGGLPVTLEEMMRAYLVLAGDGRTGDFRWHDGQIGEPSQKTLPQRRIVSEETARQVTLFLSDPLARLPTFPRMGSEEYRFPVAVKTGTSTAFRDAWAVAWSNRYLVGAWVGHPAFRPMNRLSGYMSAAELVQQVLQVLHRDQMDGFADLSFPPPRGYRPVRVCALTGARATDACEQVFLEWFRPGEEPTDDCTAHQQRAIDRRNGLLATADTPRSQIEVRTFVSLPPRYASWQDASNLPRPPDEVSVLHPGAAPLPGLSTGPALASNRPVRLRITSPEPRTRLLRDPETPAALSTVALTVVVDPPVRQVVWYVDGHPYQTADYPYTARWRLVPGEHTFQVRIPFTPEGSPEVKVIVQ
ncbi:MAG TPA: transglycosylase domain-containing protein [Thermoanaerobaculia bacterium]|nr:transglycosylase domain-containing protein [Thermoanaerobaculia bacterium]